MKSKKKVLLNNLSKLPVEDRLEQLEKYMLEVLEIVKPIRLEKQAKELSKDRFLITCNGSYKQSKSSVAAVYRSILLPKILTTSNIRSAKSSNEAQLNAIYEALQIIITGNYGVIISSDETVKSIDIHTVSKDSIAWIMNKKKIPPQILNKVIAIRDLIVNITRLTGKPIYLEWRAKESTIDIIKVNELCHDLLESE